MGERKKKTSFFENPKKRRTAMAVATAALSLIGASGAVNVRRVWSGNAATAEVVWAIVFLGIAVVYVFIFIKAGNAEDEIGLELKEKNEKLSSTLSEAEAYLEVLQDENDIFVKVHQDIETMLYDISDFANSAVHEIERQAKLTLPKRLFDEYCRRACDRIYATLVHCYGDESRFDVSYIQLDETETKRTMVSCIAFQNTGNHPPAKYRRKINASTTNRLDCRLFCSGETGAIALIVKAEVAKAFGISEIDKCKYEQYFAMPVICPSETQVKMIGLIQVSVEGSPVRNTHGELEDLCRIVLGQFAETLLVVHKIIRSLEAMPKDGVGRLTTPGKHGKKEPK